MVTVPDFLTDIPHLNGRLNLLNPLIHIQYSMAVLCDNKNRGSRYIIQHPLYLAHFSHSNLQRVFPKWDTASSSILCFYYRAFLRLLQYKFLRSHSLNFLFSMRQAINLRLLLKTNGSLKQIPIQVNFKVAAH